MTNTLNNLSRNLLNSFACAALMVFGTCTTEQTTAPMNPSEIHIELSLGRKGVYETDFTGSPIHAIVTLSDSVEFNRIDWFTGSGQQILPNVSWNQPVDSVGVALYWAGNIPTNRDSTTEIPYDTIFVKIGLDRSNAVRVNVINRAPIIDSITIADSSVTIREKVYGEDVYVFELDSAGMVPIQLHARDFDYQNRNTMNVAWRSRDSSRVQYDRFAHSNGIFEASYQTPETNFRDTVFAQVLDGSGGNTQVAVVLYRTNGPSAIVVDSIHVGDSTIQSTDSHITYEVVSVESLYISLFTRSNNVQSQWEVGSDGTLSITDSANGLHQVLFRCDRSDCADTLYTDTSIVLGEFTAILSDGRGGEERFYFRIRKVPPNQRPVIDSISFGDTFFFPDDSSQHIAVSVMETVDLRAFYHDRDNSDEELEGNWESRVGNITAEASDVARYTALDSAYTDTITFTLQDELGFQTQHRVTLTVSYYPVVDSITINDTTLVADQSDTLSYLATLQDTLNIDVWARDPSGGSVSVSFLNKNPSMVTKTGSQSFRYLTALPESDIDSTEIVIGGRDSLEKKVSLILSIQNQRPVVDSILIEEDMYTAADPLYSYEATVLDSVSLQVFTHDPDSENVVVGWEILSGEVSSNIHPDGYQAQYVCLDTLYQDTILITARDETGGVSEKRVLILVNNSFPVIDSMRINDIVFVPQGRDDSLFFYESIAPDTVAFESFAHDPDIGDEISPEWQFRDQDQRLRVFKDRPAIEYISADSSYVDTVVLRVLDSRGAVDTKKILMAFSRQEIR